ncbi:MAG: hypothetical protein WCR52_16415 [Bacteroidota bacterium]
MKKQKILFCGVIAVLCLFISACDAPNAPLDADIRQRIDSLVTAQNRTAQLQIDSLCKRALVTELPHLVDSIKKVRQQEIEQQLKLVPK